MKESQRKKKDLSLTQKEELVKHLCCGNILPFLIKLDKLIQIFFFFYKL